MSNYESHKAENLAAGDRIKVTIRHKTDGGLNIHNKDAIVMAIAIVLFLCEFYWMTFTKPKIYIPK